MWLVYVCIYVNVGVCLCMWVYVCILCVFIWVGGVSPIYFKESSNYGQSNKATPSLVLGMSLLLLPGPSKSPSIHLCFLLLCDSAWPSHLLSALVLSSCPWKREAGAIPLVTEEQILLHCSPLLPSWWLLKSFLFFFFFTCFDFFTHKMELSFFKGKWKVSGVRNGGEGSCYSKAPNVHFRFVF